MFGMPKKQRKTKPSTKSPSKRPSKSSKTRTGLKGTTGTTATKKKTAGKSSDKPNADSSSSSTWTLKKGKLGSSARDALASVKKRSIANQSKGGDGWVKAIPSENEGMKALASDLRKARGRPRRDPDEVSQVAGLRLTPKELQQIEKKARLAGFKSWRDWARQVLLQGEDLAS